MPGLTRREAQILVWRGRANAFRHMTSKSSVVTGVLEAQPRLGHQDGLEAPGLERPRDPLEDRARIDRSQDRVLAGVGTPVSFASRSSARARAAATLRSLISS